MEYSLISVIVFFFSAYYAIAVVKVDKKSLVAACLISAFFQLIFDNYMTSLGLWVFDFSFTFGIAVPYIPVENLLFGTSLAIATIASWERLKAK